MLGEQVVGLSDEDLVPQRGSVRRVCYQRFD